MVKGMVTSTIKVVATPEARRACGWSHLAAPMTRRVKFRAESGGGDIRLDAIVKSIDRNTIELIGLGGNASWFEYAKTIKLRDQTDLGLTPASTAATIQASWSFGLGNSYYFPLVDYGSFGCERLSGQDL
jgi:hypothetical protein